MSHANAPFCSYKRPLFYYLSKILKRHFSSFNGHLLGPWGSYDDLELIPVQIRLRLASVPVSKNNELATHLSVHPNYTLAWGSQPQQKKSQQHWGKMINVVIGHREENPGLILNNNIYENFMKIS